MSALKIKAEGSVEEYINDLKDEQQKMDCRDLLKIMKKITKKEPDLWSHGAIGFGTYIYKGAN